MTFFWFGSERDAFKGFEVGSLSEGGTVSDTDWGRSSAGLRKKSATLNYDAAWYYEHSSAISEGFMHVQVSGGSSNGGVGTHDFLIVEDNAGTRIIRFRFSDNTIQNEFSIDYWDGSAYQTLSSGVVIKTAPIDVYWKYGASGFVKIYVDSELQYETGTIDTTTMWDSGGIKFLCAGSANQNSGAFNEMIVADEVTISRRVATLAPSGDGNYTQGTGSYADVDEKITNDTNTVALSSNGDKQSVTLTNLSSEAEGYAIEGVCAAVRAKREASGPSKIELGVRLNGTDYWSGSQQSLDVAYSSYTYVWETSPATSSAWTASEVNAAELMWRAIT